MGKIRKELLHIRHNINSKYSTIEIDSTKPISERVIIDGIMYRWYQLDVNQPKYLRFIQRIKQVVKGQIWYYDVHTRLYRTDIKEINLNRKQRKSIKNRCKL